MKPKAIVAMVFQGVILMTVTTSRVVPKLQARVLHLDVGVGLSDRRADQQFD